jgi:hypothetical protein
MLWKVHVFVEIIREGKLLASTSKDEDGTRKAAHDL